MRFYEESWPERFNATLSKEVMAVAVTRKFLRVGPTAVSELNLIHSRVIGMQQSRDIELSDVLQYELAPVQASIFANNGDMRIARQYRKFETNGHRSSDRLPKATATTTNETQIQECDTFIKELLVEQHTPLAMRSKGHCVLKLLSDDSAINAR